MDIRRRFLDDYVEGPIDSDFIGYRVVLNDEWQLSAVANPAPTLHDGVYESIGGGNVKKMYIYINGLTEFKLYVSSPSSRYYDWVAVSTLDTDIGYDTSYSSSLCQGYSCQASTNSNLSGYTTVQFSNIDGGFHVITIVFRNLYTTSTPQGYLIIRDPDRFPANGAINVNNFLTIVANEDNVCASLSTFPCHYCINGDGVWKYLKPGVYTESIMAGDTISFRGETVPRTKNNLKGCGEFIVNGSFSLIGTIMSMLLDVGLSSTISGVNYAFYKMFLNNYSLQDVSEGFLPSTSVSQYCYSYLFSGCTSLRNSPNLPATSMAESCYSYMFNGCTSLTTPPNLPATSIAAACYSDMFNGCSSLTTAPDLPATYMRNSAYSSMFKNCTSLVSAPELPATSAGSYDYSWYASMFHGCKNLENGPSILPIKTLQSHCYSEMFNGCSKLKSAPEISATSIRSSYGDDSHCRNMFGGCTSLTKAPELNSTTVAEYCYYGMFYGCTNLEEGPSVLPATTLADYCYGSMFSGCSKLNVAPELPAETLVYRSYIDMFYNCSSLNYIKCLAKDKSADGAVSDWTKGVSSSGTFVKASGSSWSTGQSGIPSGWTVTTE